MCVCRKPIKPGWTLRGPGPFPATMSAAPAVYEIEVGGVGAGAAAPALNDSMGSIAHGIGRVQRRLPHRGSTLGRRRRRHPPGRSWPCGGFFNSLHVARPAHSREDLREDLREDTSSGKRLFGSSHRNASPGCSDNSSKSQAWHRSSMLRRSMPRTPFTSRATSSPP